jgi:hypothetical protein
MSGAQAALKKEDKAKSGGSLKIIAMSAGVGILRGLVGFPLE